MPEPIVIPNGAFVSLQPTDSGFAHGFGLFESIRFEGGRLLHWSAHWQRLQESASALGLDCPQDEGSILRAIGKLVSIDAPGDSTIKLSLLRERRADQLYVYSRPPIAWPEASRLSWRPDCPLSTVSKLAGHKTHNYMENIYLLEQSRSAGFDDCLRPASCGSVGETTVANIFWFRDSVLYTPSIDLGVLPGVVRALLLRFAASMDISCIKGAFRLNELLSAEAIFMANASIGLLPVKSVHGPGLDCAFESAVHPLFHRLREALRHEEEKSALRPVLSDSA